MKKKKLTLNKEKVTKLTKDRSAIIQGGNERPTGSAHSTNNGFTCCWCTTGDDTKDSWNTCTSQDITKIE